MIMRNVLVLVRKCVASVLLMLLFSGFGAPAFADDAGNGGQQKPSGSLFLVPAGIGEIGPGNSTRIHDYGPQRLALIPNPDALSAYTRSRITAIADPTALSYRGWTGTTQPLSERAIQALPLGYYLIALAGPADKQWEAAFANLGIAVVDAAKPYALVVHADGGQLLRAASVTTSFRYPVVLGIAVVPIEARLDPQLLMVAFGPGTLSDVPGLRKSADGRGVVRVVPFDGANLASVLAEVRKYAAAPNPALAFGYDDAILITGPELATILANVAGVAYLEPLHERQLHNNIAAKSTILNIEPVWTLGYNGTGIIVDHNDSGVDATHPDFPAGTILATAGTQSGTDNGHGTHTAGSVLGRGLAPGGSPTNNSGCLDVTAPFATVRGMAPGARLVTNNLFVPGATGKTTEVSMMQWGYQQGARLSTNSWGYTTTYTYSTNSQDVDTAVRDADLGTAGNQEMSILFSAGNDGAAAGTIGTPGTAKNAITVGASQNDRCGSYVPSNCAGPSINNMACFSGRGPAQGRIKPDVVAIGTDVLSTQSQDPAATYPWDQPWTGTWYALDPGTSMSCPITAGATATFYSFYNATYGVLPSPALAKAALINGAVDMGFGYPSYDQGWGRINLLRSVQGPPGGSIAFVDQSAVTPLATGASWTRTFTVGSSAVPLKVTLVWTDPPGAAGCASCLINDLNLVVTAPGGTIYRGNQFTANWSTPNPVTTDIANNVENVFVQTPATGTWTIQVTSANTAVNPPGLAGQDFALVYSANFCPPPGAPTAVTATANGNNRIDLSWIAPGGVPAPTEYRVLRGTTLGGPYAQIAVVTAPATIYSDTTVSGGVTYYYVVRAFNACESGNSNEASATATGACSVPPTFAGLASVTAPSNATCTLTLSWAAATAPCGGAVTYSVYRSTTNGFIPALANRIATGVAALAYTDTAGLASGATFYYIVRATDSGNGQEDTNTVQKNGSPQGTITYAAWTDDGGDTGAAKLTVQPTWTNAATGGRTAAKCYATGTYTNNMCASATTPVLNVGPGGGTLTFWSKYDIEAGWDKGQVELSTDGGATWARLAITTYPANSTRTGDACGFPSGTKYFTGTNLTYASFTATLPAGPNVMVRWRLSSDFSVTKTGWWIDDISITNVGTPGPCGAAPNDTLFLTATATSAQVKVEWLNPADASYTGTRVVYKAGAAPTGPTDGTATLLVDDMGAFQSQHRTATALTLTNTTTYYFAAYVRNAGGLYSAGKTVTATPFVTTGKVKWAYSTGAAALTSAGIWPGAIGTGKVLSVSNDRVLHETNPSSTGGDWPASWIPLAMNGPSQDRPLMTALAFGGATHTVFVSSQDGHVYGVNADTGAQIWQSALLGDMVQASPSAIFTAYGGTWDLLFAGTRNGAAANSMVALNPATGATVWQFTNAVAQGGDGLAIGIISSQPYIDYANKRLYFTSRSKGGGSSNTAWCLDFTNLSVTKKWAMAIGDSDASPMLFQPAGAPSSRVYVGTTGGMVYALDPVTGATVWGAPYATGDGAIKAWVLPQRNSNQLYLSTTTRVWCLLDNGASVALKWNVTLPGVGVAPSTPVYLNGANTLLVGSGDGKVYLLDTTLNPPPTINSVTLSSVSTAGVGTPSFDVVNNVYYVGSQAGVVYVVLYP